jgi:DNA topoisomerase IB
MSGIRLLHAHGGEPGLRRERRGRRFVHLQDATGEPVTDADTIARV